MFRKELVLAAVVILAFWACDLEAVQIASTWVGGSQGEWGQASNWNPAIVPDNGGGDTFNVTIDAGAGEVYINLQQWRTVNRLDCDGEVELHNWTSSWVELALVDPSGLTNHGDLVIEGPGFEITGNVTNITGATLDLEDMDIGGDLYNQAGATIEVYDEIYVDGVVENAGSIIVTLLCDLEVENAFHNTGQIQLYGGSCGTDDLFHNDVNGVVEGFGVLFTEHEQILQNEGRIIASGGSLAVFSKESSLTNTGTLANKATSTLHIKPANDVDNQGTIEVNAGGGVAFDCNLVNDPNGVITLLGGTLAATSITQTADADFAGFGSITGDILIESGAKIELTGPTNIVGDVNIPAGTTLEISDGQTLITGHTVCDGTIHLIGGTVIFQGGCDCADCDIINEAGIDRNHFDLNADGIENFKDFAYFAETWLWQASWY